MARVNVSVRVRFRVTVRFSVTFFARDRFRIRSGLRI